jgi:hypothetical protein
MGTLALPLGIIGLVIYVGAFLKILSTFAYSYYVQKFKRHSREYLMSSMATNVRQIFRVYLVLFIIGMLYIF